MTLAVADLQRLSSLLDEALDLSAPERTRWLAALPDEARPLAGTLRELLARHAEAETGDFAPAPLRLLAEASDRAGEVAEGAQLGPYRLIRELGTGGMGAVWLAERADGLLDRKVALKLPHAGWTRGLAQRFARERAILSALEHPHIARLYDAGEDGHGRPYMALEYVEGEAIDAYCRAHALDVPARLGLLLQVADAVAFAHSRLVLHRDLKPGNILVTATAQVRLLDFGIAKLMHGEQAEETALTRAGGRPLTLEYASPEQIRGEPLGTASDVYSLGVVAYELLAGERPHRPQRPGAAALEAAIVDEDAPLASQRTADPDLRKRLQGDIDAILNKALKRSLGERYATVDGFALDLRLHLEGQRVLARPDTAAYRVLRLARRHRWPLAASAAAALAFGLALGLGATALLLVVLLAGLGAALLLARRAARERDRALKLAERNAAGNAFIETLLTRAARGGAFTAMQLIERGERLMDGDAPGNPEHRAFVLGLIANLYTQLDQHAHALPLLERALDAARRGTDPLLRDSLASRRAISLGWLGRTDEALAVIDALLSRPDAPAELRCEVHMHRAKLAQLTGDFPATLHHATEALRWYRAAPHLPQRHEPVLQAELGWASLKNGRGEQAERHYAAAAAAFEALGLADSAAALQHGGTRALMYQELGDLRRSIALYDELLASARRATPDIPPSVYLQANRAYALAHHGRFDDAEAGYRESAELARQQGLALVHYNIRMLVVELEAMRRRPEAARQELAAAEAERDFDAPEGGPAEFARQQAEAYLAMCEGKYELAVKVFGDALMNRHVAAGTANALLGRAAAHEVAEAWEMAETDARDALEIAEKLRGQRPSSSRSGLAWLALARVHARRGDIESSRRDALAALPHLRAQLDAQHPALAEAQRLAGPDERRH